jgi:hypothetical protein
VSSSAAQMPKFSTKNHVAKFSRKNHLAKFSQNFLDVTAASNHLDVAYISRIFSSLAKFSPKGCQRRTISVCTKVNSRISIYFGNKYKCPIDLRPICTLLNEPKKVFSNFTVSNQKTR